jgi:hypothetical protein
MAGEKDRVDVDEAALTTYRGTAGNLAEQVRSVGTGTLGGANSLPADAFGKIGAEVGLSGAFQQAAQAQLDGVAATASGIAALGQAVGNALAGYQQQDADAASRLRQSAR